jgi:hypothetical protein
MIREANGLALEVLADGVFLAGDAQEGELTWIRL